jgi:hypothetical protein
MWNPQGRLCCPEERPWRFLYPFLAEKKSFRRNAGSLFFQEMDASNERLLQLAFIRLL